VNIADGLPQLGQFPLIKYGSRTGAGSFVLGSLPVGVVASVVTNGPNSSIDLNITTVNTPRWDGQAGGNWDIGLTTNWVNAGTGLPTTFANGNPVTFDDNALGTTTVNLVTTVSPATVTANDSILNYTLVGSGKISGSGSFTKQGSGIFTIANTGGNNYTGPTVAGAGTLSVTNLANGGSPSAIGASSANPTNLVLQNGALSYSGPAVSINRGYLVQGTNATLGVQSNLTLSGQVTAAIISGFTKSGAAQLTYTTVGTNVLAGSAGYTAQNGTVLFDGSAGSQTNTIQGQLRVSDSNGFNAAISLTNTVVNVTGSMELGNSGSNATATLTLNSNSVLTMQGNPFAIGRGPSAGVVVHNAGTLDCRNELWIGQGTSGNGSYTFSGGSMLCSNWVAIGRANASGSMTMTGGTLTRAGSGSAFIVGTGAGNNGLNSTGFFDFNGGTISCFTEYWLAENTGSIGTNNIRGTAVLNLNNWMSIGRGGLGVINFSGGAINRAGAGAAFIVGDGGTGYFIHTGGTLTSANELWIGQGGGATGEYDLSGSGSVTVNNWVAVGRGGGTGTLNMSGGTLTKTGNGGNHFIIGAGGPGTLNQTGGTLASVLSDTWVGESATATWNLNGGSAVLSVVHISQNSGVTGTLNLNGGSLSATEVTTGNAGGNSTLNLNGGTLAAASGANLNFLHDLTTANVMSGGAIIDSGTNIINASQALLDGGGGGGLTKNGTGTLRLNGTNTYTGTTLASAGTLGGTGTIAGPLNVAAGATLAPGASIGTFTVSNNATLGGTTLMEISKDGGVPASDLLAVSGNLAYGGTLTVVLIGTNTLAYNDTFHLFSWGTQSGSFAAINLPSGYSWDTSQLNVNGTIRVLAVSPAVINSSRVSGGNLILQGAGGPPGTSYTWLTHTNVAAPLSSWTTNSTGTFDSNAAFSNAFPVTTTVRARFFRLKTP
jgi:autotransporter-associated beta strand protein